MSIPENQYKGISPYSPTIEFGTSEDGNAEIVATYDMLGFHLFYYDERVEAYSERGKELLWRIPISRCRNLDSHSVYAFPGMRNLRQYWESGFDSLGYVSTVCDNPELAEFLDNPGILILLIANLPKAKGILARNPNRVDLVRQLVDSSSQIGRYHINWLKKVRPTAGNPAAFATDIVSSILKIQPIGSACQQHSSTQLFKLFAHQTRWTPRGVAFARMLLSRPDLTPGDVSWLLQSLNGKEFKLISKVRQGLHEFRKLKQLPAVVAKRAYIITTNPEFLTLDFSRRFRRVVRRGEGESGIVDICSLFVGDDDIPSPIVKGNQQVKPLNTFSKIRDQARRARNCLWSLDILNKILTRELDLYSVEGENLYTISVDRRTLDIRMIEAAKSTMIRPRDLSVIVEWFDECTQLPR